MKRLYLKGFKEMNSRLSSLLLKLSPGKTQSENSKRFQWKDLLHDSRYGSEGGVCRMSAADQRQIPAQGHRLSLAWSVRALRGVRGRAQELLLCAGPQTLLQTGLCWVSPHDESLSASNVSISISLFNRSMNERKKKRFTREIRQWNYLKCATFQKVNRFLKLQN